MKTNLIFNLLYGLFAFLFVISCSKKEDDNPRPLNENPVILSSLEAGQRSYFRRYHLECDTAPGFEWTSDTLVLEVITKENKLYLQESLTPSSPMFLDGAFQEPVQYEILPISDAVLLPERANSALFFFYANDTLRLNPTTDVTLTQNACKLHLNNDPFIGNDIGFIADLSFGDIKLQNQTVVSCEPFFNLDAYLVYDGDALMMSHVVTLASDLGGYQTEEVYGWCLIQ